MDVKQEREMPDSYPRSDVLFSPRFDVDFGAATYHSSRSGGCSGAYAPMIVWRSP